MNDETPERFSEELAETRRQLAQANRRVEVLEIQLAACQQSREAVPENQAELSAAFEQAPIVMALADRERRVRRANRAAIEYTGHPAGRMIGQRSGEALRCLHALNEPEGCGYTPYCETCALRRTMLDTIETGRSYRQVEVRLPLLRQEAAEEAILLVSTTPVVAAGEQMVLVSIEDVTGYRGAEERLRVQSAALDATANGIVITDREGNITWANPAFTQLTGYAVEEVLGQNPRLLKSGRHEPAFYARLWDTILAGQVWHDSLVNRRKDGTLYVEEMTITPVLNEAGDISHFIAIKQDVTAREQAQAALRRHTTELEARNEELGAFAHTVAHDLKNPLNIVVGYAEVLEGAHASLTPDDLQKRLHTIARSGRKMGAIIDELLLLSGLRQVDVEAVPIAMADIIAEALQRLADVAEEARAEILVPDSWPQAVGYGPWIEEVWVNYLSNAIKYGGQPPHVALGAEVLPEGAVRFWVRDNGPGLTQEEQTRLFKLFTRLDQAHAKGHGLGLSIVRRIVEKLGGEVGVESTVGQGSTFSFTLPGAEPKA